MHWDGTAWVLVPPRTPHDDPISDLFGVSCVSGLSCVAVGLFATLNGPYRTLAERFAG